MSREKLNPAPPVARRPGLESVDTGQASTSENNPDLLRRQAASIERHFCLSPAAAAAIASLVFGEATA